MLCSVSCVERHCGCWKQLDHNASRKKGLHPYRMIPAYLVKNNHPNPRRKAYRNVPRLSPALAKKQRLHMGSHLKGIASVLK